MQKVIRIVCFILVFSSRKLYGSTSHECWYNLISIYSVLYLLLPHCYFELWIHCGLSSLSCFSTGHLFILVHALPWLLLLFLPSQISLFLPSSALAWRKRSHLLRKGTGQLPTIYTRTCCVCIYTCIHTYTVKSPYNLSPNYKIPQSRAYDFLLQQSCCNAF